MLKDNLNKTIESLNEKLDFHGGGVELVDFDEKEMVIKLRLKGACSHCPMAQMTTENFIKKELLANLPGLKEITMVG